MQLTAEQFLGSLHKLTPDQLAQVHARTSVLLGSSAESTPTGKRDAEVELVHEAINEALKEHGEIRGMPLTVLRKQKHVTLFKSNAAMLLEYIDRYFKPANKTDRLRAVKLLVGMVGRRLLARGRPVSHQTISQGIGKVNSVVESQFPGYRASNMLPMLLKAKTSSV